MKKTIYTLILILCTFRMQAQILQENFSAYTVGGDLNGQGGWSNNTSNPGGGGNCAGAICTNQKVAAVALNVAGYGSSSKAITVDPGRDGVGKGWAANVTSGSIYAAFVVNFSDIACSGTCSNEFGFFRLQDRSGTFSFVVRMYVKKVNASTFQVGVEKGSSNNRVYSTLAYNFNSANLIVLKYTINSGSGSDDVVRVYMNPDMTMAEPGSADINTNLGNDLSTSIDVAAVQYNFNSSGLLPVGNHGLLSVVTQWSQLPFGAAAVNNIDRDFSNAKVFAASSTQAIFQMNSTRADNITIEMTDVMGRVVLRQQAKLNAGSNSFVLQTGALSKGIYNVRAVSSKGVSSTVRFMQ
jgi:hypothetical protein